MKRWSQAWLGKARARVDWSPRAQYSGVDGQSTTLTARAASTRPKPVAPSGPGPAIFPWAFVPTRMSRAVYFRMFLTWSGVKVGSASFSSAQTPATIGLAAEVPLNAPHPPCLSRVAPLSTGSTM